MLQALLRGLLKPLRSTVLLLVVSFALGLALAARAGLLGLPLALILLSWYCKYAFVCFDAGVRGLPEPPVLSIDMINPLNEQRPLGVLLIVGVFLGATAAIRPWIGDAPVTGLRTAALLVLPASVAVLGLTGNLIDAVNPRTLAQFVRRLGAGYVVVLLAVALVFGAWWLAYSRWSGDGGLALLAALSFDLYTGLALFCVIGEILYVRRRELGYDAWVSPERTQARADATEDRRQRQLIDVFYFHWRGGAHAEAWSAVQGYLAAQQHAATEYEWLRERLLAWPDQRLAHKLARAEITRRLGTNDRAGALAVARRHVRADREFRPETAGELVELLETALAGGERSTARVLAADFNRYYPGDSRRATVTRITEELAR